MIRQEAVKVNKNGGDMPSKERSCDKKRPYKQNKADRVASIMNASQKKWVHAYKCEYCAWWHIGGMSLNKRIK